MILDVTKCHPNAKLPVRAHTWDAGADVFALEDECIYPGKNAVLRTGLKISVPTGYMVQVMNKSGIASKNGLVVGACVIDPGYVGELMIDLHNIGYGEATHKNIRAGDKIGQSGTSGWTNGFIQLHLELHDVTDMSEDEKEHRPVKLDPYGLDDRASSGRYPRPGQALAGLDHAWTCDEPPFAIAR